LPGISGRGENRWETAEFKALAHHNRQQE